MTKTDRSSFGRSGFILPSVLTKLPSVLTDGQNTTKTIQALATSEKNVAKAFYFAVFQPLAEANGNIKFMYLNLWLRPKSKISIQL